jgi:hypothetical protein
MQAFAFKLYMESDAGAADKEQVRLRIKGEWCTHPSTTETYIQV